MQRPHRQRRSSASSAASCRCSSPSSAAISRIGASLPVIPLFVHGALGYGPVIVGITIGAQALVTVLTRPWAGQRIDRDGPKAGMLVGVCACTVSGLCYLAAALLAAHPHASLAALLLGRVVLGIGDSFVVTGALSWGIARLGPQHSGRVMTWHGIAMYGAVAAGAPVGLLIGGSHGFIAVAWLVILLPLVSVLVAVNMARAAVHAGKRLPFFAVLGQVWKAGLGLALGSIGFAAVTTFATLLFVTRGWAGTSFALTVFACAYVLPRSLYSGITDRLGGASVAAVSLSFEALGQLLIWNAPGPALAFAGLAFAGLGCSMMYPGLGVVAIAAVPATEPRRGAGCFRLVLQPVDGPERPAARHRRRAVRLSGHLPVRRARRRGRRRPGVENRQRATRRDRRLISRRVRSPAYARPRRRPVPRR